MQEYLHSSRLGEWMNGLGLHLLVLAGALGWFVMLWGIRLSALTAGVAFYLLLMLCIRKAQRRRLKKKEARLRRRIGGEMALERLLTAAPARAHFELTMLLSLRHPLSLLRTGEQGMLCSLRGETLLIALQQLPSGSQATAEHVLALQRHARSLRAQRAVLCVPCSIHASARDQALSDIPVSFLGREALVDLLGAANPATDSQLAALARRRRARGPACRWAARVLDPRRAPRCALYGLLLLFLYAASRLFYYLVPGLGLLGLAAFIRIRERRHGREEPL